MKVAILIPAYNEAPRISGVINIAKQARNANEVVVVDDGSSDGTSAIAEKTCRVIRYTENRGKLKAIRDAINLVIADIYITIDSDISGFTPEDIDNLINPLINDPGIIMTVGRCNFNGTTSMDDCADGSIHAVHQNVSGQRGYRRMALDKTFELAENIERRYPHICFRYMLEHCSCGAMIKIAGRIKEIPFGYNIVNPNKDSKWGGRKNEENYVAEKRILDLEIYGTQREKIAVVMATYARPDNFRGTLACLTRQEYNKFGLFVWNNNPKIKDSLEDTIRDYGGQLKYKMYHSVDNIGGFARFNVCRDLVDSYRYAVFIDDDEVFEQDFIWTLAGEALPRTVSSTWAFRFRAGGNYWQRDAGKPGEEVNYCGTRGMIIDTAIFKERQFYDAPKMFWIGIEDLWMSYYAQHILGWRLIKSRANIMVLGDDKDISAGLGKEKIMALERLRKEMGWKV